MEEFDSCLQLYKEVVKNSQDEYDDERQTNVSAVKAALSLGGSDTNLVIYCSSNM